MSPQSQPCTACSSDTRERVEQYFHIASVIGQKAGIGSKPCIVLEFARYTYASGEVVNKTLTWHGPFPSIRAAKALIGLRKAQPTTDAAAPNADRKV